MPVTLPPWLNIDPIAPARIRLAANAQRNAAAAQERSAANQAAELGFRREQLASQTAAQERAEERRDRVFRQTQDQELAIAAGNQQLRREAQAAKAEQFQQNLRMRQQAAEREAKTAALQMQGMQAVQKGLEAGEPLQKLIAQNAPMIFARHPERLPTAVPKAVAGPADYVARELHDEQGRPLGVHVIPGAHGSIKPLPRTSMSPEGMLRADQLRLGVINRQLEEADPNTSDYARLVQSRDAIMTRLEQLSSGRGAASSAETGINPLGSSAASASSSTVRVKSPKGVAGVIPRAQLDAALKAGYSEIAPAEAPSHEEDLSEEEMAAEEE